LRYKAQGSPVCGDTLGDRRIKISTPTGLRKILTQMANAQL